MKTILRLSLCVAIIGVVSSTEVVPSLARAQQANACPVGTQERGSVADIDGATSVRAKRAGVSVELKQGSLVCSADVMQVPRHAAVKVRLKPNSTPVTIKGQVSYLVPGRDVWLEAALGGSFWSSYLSDQKFLATGGRGTLSPPVATLTVADVGDFLYFAIPGLDTGRAVLGARRGLTLWNRSPAGQPISIRLTSPDGRLAFEGSPPENENVLRIPDLDVVPGIWRLRVNTPAREIDGSFKVVSRNAPPALLAASEAWQSMGVLDQALIFACYDVETNSLEALQWITGSSEPDDARLEAGLTLSFWRHKNSAVGCAGAPQ